MLLAVAVDDVEGFVLQHLPPPPERVLEVGCGEGQLATALAGRGYDITAIDPRAPDGPLFRKTSLEDFSEASSFAAVVASRSLHHVEDIELGVAKIYNLLRPGGLLILDEFSWDQMDEATARWYSEQSADPLSDDFLDEWIDEHRDMHTATGMTDALQGRFQTKSLEWLPYIAQHYLEQDDLVAPEMALIRSGEIKPLGFRYVGVRT